MQKQDVTAAFQIGAHPFFGIRTRMRLVAGRADHIQDQKLAVPIPVRVLQRFPLIVEKCNLLFQFNGQVLVNDLARMNPVMIVCKKIYHKCLRNRIVLLYKSNLVFPFNKRRKKLFTPLPPF